MSQKESRPDLASQNESSSNIIRFDEKLAEKGRVIVEPPMKIDSTSIKAMVVTTIGLVVFAVSFANRSIFSPAEDVANVAHFSLGQSRGVASVPTGTSASEDQFHASIAARPLSGSTGLGLKPSEIDRLTFGFLEGKYSVHLENGKVKELAFVDSSSQSNGDRPTYLKDPVEFLQNNREIFPREYSEVRSGATLTQKDQIVRSYALMQKTDQVGEVQVTLDLSGRLLSMKFEPKGSVSNK